MAKPVPDPDPKGEADPAAGAPPPAGRGGREPEAGAHALPPASLSFLVAGLAAQAQVAMGRIENPLTKRTETDLAAARHAIDLLEVLEAKTKGNLEAQEIALLSHVLWDLRLAYVQAKEGART